MTDNERFISVMNNSLHYTGISNDRYQYYLNSDILINKDYIRLVIDIRDKHNIEIPNILYNKIAKLLYDNYNSTTDHLETLVVSMEIKGIIFYKTAMPAIYEVMNHNPPSLQLKKIKIDENVYYGFNGLILDSEKHPLMCITNNICYDGSNTYSNGKTLKISPLVYEKDDKMSKTIRGKVFNNFVKGMHNFSISNVSIENMDNLIHTNNGKSVIYNTSLNDEQIERLAFDMQYQATFI